MNKSTHAFGVLALTLVMGGAAVCQQSNSATQIVKFGVVRSVQLVSSGVDRGGNFALALNDLRGVQQRPSVTKVKITVSSFAETGKSGSRETMSNDRREKILATRQAFVGNDESSVETDLRSLLQPGSPVPSGSEPLTITVTE